MNTLIALLVLFSLSLVIAGPVFDTEKYGSFEIFGLNEFKEASNKKIDLKKFYRFQLLPHLQNAFEMHDDLTKQLNVFASMTEKYNDIENLVTKFREDATQYNKLLQSSYNWIEKRIPFVKEINALIDLSTARDAIMVAQIHIQSCQNNVKILAGIYNSDVDAETKERVHEIKQGLYEKKFIKQTETAVLVIEKLVNRNAINYVIELAKTAGTLISFVRSILF